MFLKNHVGIASVHAWRKEEKIEKICEQALRPTMPRLVLPGGKLLFLIYLFQSCFGLVCESRVSLLGRCS